MMVENDKTEQDVDEQSQLDEQVGDLDDAEEDVEDDLVDDDETEGDDVVTDDDLTDDDPKDDAEVVPAQNEQMELLAGQMGQLVQIVNGLVQHQQNSSPAATTPQQQVDLEDMSMTDVAKHILGTANSVFQRKLNEQQKEYQGGIQRLGGRFMEVLESVANDPQSFPQVKEALEMLQRSPGIKFQDAMKAVGSKKIGKANQQLHKQNKSDRRRRQKLSKKTGGRKPESVSHKKTKHLTPREATLQAMAELGMD